MVRLRIAFDLDETLGTAITDHKTVTGFNIRKGCDELLTALKKEYHLVIWTVSSRGYLEKMLNFGIREYFDETYSWDEISEEWKDIRKINVRYLVDDSSYHREMAKQHNLEAGYIIVPAYGSREDQRDPLLWVRQVYDYLESRA